MMATIQSYVRQGRSNIHRLVKDPRARLGIKMGGFLLLGFVMSGASLGHYAQPLVLCLVCGLSGLPSCLTALGGAAGYLVFWGRPGIAGLTWTAAGLIAALAAGDRKLTRATPVLLPAVSALILAASGLFFQYALDDRTPFAMYLLRIILGAGGTALMQQLTQTPSPVSRWLGCGFLVLALAQVIPVPWMNPGYLAAGFLAAGAAFPVTALAGLALDLSQISRVPMTAALCLAWFVRFLPARRIFRLAPAGAYGLVMALCGVWAPAPMIPLALGGMLSLLYPGQSPVSHRRGETGVAQVRLELMGGVLEQARQLLQEMQDPPIDERALLSRCGEAACGGCSCRRSCQDKERVAAMAPGVLHARILQETELPVRCKKAGRVLSELHRVQEHYRLLCLGRERQQEYRQAVIQQYSFLSQYVQDLSDVMGRRHSPGRVRYSCRVSVYANRRESENGDRCCWFAGTENRYYILLCDGMGRGQGAVEEGSTALLMLRRMLTAGFPAEHALRSLNSLCALRGRAGAVTVDLAQIDLVSGKTVLYKWGAPASYRISSLGAEKIGTATPPPGLSVTEGRETVERLSLRKGEILVMLSDGVGGEDALKGAQLYPDQPLGEIAAEILELSDLKSGDDATVAVIRLGNR